jgi:LuxR family maltose regulon positive regulatory protein
MDHPLLMLKFHVPPLKSNLIKRPRLYKLLNETFEKKLTIVSAPAGFGKSSLLGDWLRDLPCRYAWLSLDQDDNDYARFLKYFVAALQQLDSAIDNTVLDLLYSPQPMIQNAALAALINQIDDIETVSVLILDDYHLISNQQIHHSIEYLLNYLPQNFHLVISTRADPPFAYSLLRAQGELVEIRMNDLKFTEEEAAVFISEQPDLRVSDQVISELTKRTEGWISGLQMASLSLRGKANAEEFVQTFSGSHRYILDYLFEEVLRQQPEDLQRFLLFTSPLERMSAALCDEILGRSDSQAVLEQLEKANAFLVALDDERIWYRYHQLFKDLLNYHLTMEYKEEVPELYKKASVWYEHAGWLSLAVDYSIRAKDYKRAVALISKEAEHTLIRSEVNIYQNWISKLPPEFVESNQDIQFLNVWAQILQGDDPDFGSLIFEDVNGDSNLSGRILALQAFLYTSKGDFALAGDMARKALEELDQEDEYFCGMSAWISGVYYALQQDVEGAVAILEKLSTSVSFMKYPMLNVLLLSQIAHAHTRLGNFVQARQRYQQALDSAKDRQGNWTPIAGEALMGYGDLLREQNELDQATDMILDGIELTMQWREVAAIEGYLFLSRVKQLQNNFSAANAALEKAMDLAVQYTAIDFDDRMVEMWQARLLCFEGKENQIDSWIQRLQLKGELEIFLVEGGFNIENYLFARENVVLARYYMLTNQYTEAISLTDKLLVIFDDYGRLDLLIELYLLRAGIFHKTGQQENSFSALSEAIRIGERGGFLGSFLECGLELKELLQEYNQIKVSSMYCQKILDAFQIAPPISEQTVQPLIEPLSDRELNVLKYLPTNLTTPEIAYEMNISINTVRTHIKNIYQKLDVHKRSQAVLRSQELDLIR